MVVLGRAYWCRGQYDICHSLHPGPCPRNRQPPTSLRTASQRFGGLWNRGAESETTCCRGGGQVLLHQGLAAFMPLSPSPSLGPCVHWPVPPAPCSWLPHLLWGLPDSQPRPPGGSRHAHSPPAAPSRVPPCLRGQCAWVTPATTSGVSGEAHPRLCLSSRCERQEGRPEAGRAPSPGRPPTPARGMLFL